MESDNISLGRSVTHLTVDGKNVYLVGTAHVSQKSVLDVEETINIVKPDVICVELCDARYHAIVNRDAWQKMDIIKIIKEKKSLFLLSQLIMTSFYRRLGAELGVQPGAEMIKGIQLSEESGAKLVLADRQIEITLKRAWISLGFWNKFKMTFNLFLSLFSIEGIDKKLIEEMKEKDQLENIMHSFAKSFPSIKKTIIDERDIYLAQKIRNASGKTVVAVVGAGHVEGIKKYIHQYMPIDGLIEIPHKSAFSGIIKWVIPAMIIGLIGYGFLGGKVDHPVESIYIWILVTGILSALGTAIAFAHPVTILSAFLGAPITTLHPMIAVGWVAGLVQVWIKKPTVTDFEQLPEAITTLKGFWTNPVSRILLIVVLANVGGSLGTFIAASWIAMRTY